MMKVLQRAASVTHEAVFGPDSPARGGVVFLVTLAAIMLPLQILMPGWMESSSEVQWLFWPSLLVALYMGHAAYSATSLTTTFRRLLKGVAILIGCGLGLFVAFVASNWFQGFVSSFTLDDLPKIVIWLGLAVLAMLWGIGRSLDRIAQRYADLQQEFHRRRFDEKQ